jgi:hypothetical protein
MEIESGSYVTLSRGLNDDILGIYESGSKDKISVKLATGNVKKDYEYFVLYEGSSGIMSVRVKALDVQRDAIGKPIRANMKLLDKPKPFHTRAYMRYPIKMDLKISTDNSVFISSKSLNISEKGIAFTIPEQWVKRGEEVYIKTPGHDTLSATVRWVSNMDGAAGALLNDSAEELLYML